MAQEEDVGYKYKSSLPNKLLQSDGAVTDIAGNPVVNAVEEYEAKTSLPNKFLNPDGTYSTLNEIIASMIDTELFIIVDELPETGESNKIYLLVDGNKLIEYAWVNDTWNPIGMVEFDLNNYYTKTEVTQLISTALQSAKDYADNLFNSISVDPEVFYWDGKEDQTGIDFWNNVRDINKTQNVVVFWKGSRGGSTVYYASRGINDLQSPSGNKVKACPTMWMNGYMDKYITFYHCVADVTFEFDNDRITSVHQGSTLQERPILNYRYQGDDAFIPTYPGQTATKKYVDDSINNSITQVLGGEY